jgi:hypothetical protein
MMPYPAPPNDIQIDRIHSGAVCKEMGDRLSVALGPQSIELPPRLLALIEQLAKVETHEDLGFRPDQFLH